MLRAALAGLRRLIRRQAADEELDDEVRHFIEEATREHMRAGLAREAAERRARIDFGGMTNVTQRVRESGWESHVHTLQQDVRFGARTLRRNPGFTTVALLTIALGVGVNSAMFSLVDRIILETLPVQRPRELMALTMPDRDDSFTNPLWEAIRDRQDAFVGAFAFAAATFDLSNGGESRSINGSYVSGDYFTTLGVSPQLGRLFTRVDDVRGCPPVAVVSRGFWERELRGASSAVWRPGRLSLNGNLFDIVGVVPPTFHGVHVGTSVDVYVPLCAEAVIRGAQSALDGRTTWFLHVMGRKRPDLTLAQVRARLAAIAPAAFAATVPTEFDSERRQSYRQSTLGAVNAATGLSPLRLEYQRPLLVLMGAAALVLLIACANVANLLLARAGARRRELAIRVAVGAGRRRLVRQLFTESLLLSLLGAALGVVFAHWSSGVLVRMLAAQGTPVSLGGALNGRLLAFSIVVAMLTALIFGLVPAWKASHADAHEAMKGEGGSRVTGPSHARVRSTFVVAQIALSLILVTAAALLLSTFRRLATMDPGFRGDGVLLVAMDFRKAKLNEEQERLLRGELLARVRAIPGVRAASASQITPVSGRGWNAPIAVEGYTPRDRRDAMIFLNEVADSYFATLDIPLAAGRELMRTDRHGAPSVAVINETMARKFFGAASPVGRHFRVTVPGSKAGPVEKDVEVVGLVRDAKYSSLRETPRAIAYLSLAQSVFTGTVNYVVRSDASLASVVPLVTAAATSIDARITLQYTTLTKQMTASIARERLLATLATSFGALALLLAVVGTYGTIAYGVVRRRNEIGIRLALGAERIRVVRMVLGESGRLLVFGVALGVAGVLAATRLIAAFLYGVTATDPGVIVISVVTLVVATLAASALPAWRAARIDPVNTLRDQ